MKISLEEYTKDDIGKNLYTFCSAKKIYLASTPYKYFLLEKCEDKPIIKSISLCSRNTVVICKKNGMLLFP
jgi:hypothetical protein